MRMHAHERALHCTRADYLRPRRETQETQSSDSVCKQEGGWARIGRRGVARGVARAGMGDVLAPGRPPRTRARTVRGPITSWNALRGAELSAISWSRGCPGGAGSLRVGAGKREGETGEVAKVQAACALPGRALGPERAPRHSGAHEPTRRGPGFIQNLHYVKGSPNLRNCP